MAATPPSCRVTLGSLVAEVVCGGTLRPSLITMLTKPPTDEDIGHLWAACEQRGATMAQLKQSLLSLVSLPAILFTSQF